MENTFETRYDMSDEDKAILAEATGSAPPKPRDMPNIDHLEDAVKFDEAGRPYLDLKPGDKVVIERHTSMFKDHPWLDTKVYHLNEVDQATGVLKLFYEELHQHARDNFVAGLLSGGKYKKLPTTGRWDVAPKVVRKVQAPVQSPSPAPANGEQPVKRGRGRPPGVKNRPKDVIVAERKALKEARLAKKAARLAKKAGR